VNAKLDTSAQQQSSLSVNNACSVGDAAKAACTAPGDTENPPIVGFVLEGFHLHESLPVDDPDIDDRVHLPLGNTAEGILSGTTHQMLPDLRIVFQAEEQLGDRVDYPENNFPMEWHYPGRNNVAAILPEMEMTDMDKSGSGASSHRFGSEYVDKARRDEAMVQNYLGQTKKRNQLISKGIFNGRPSVPLK
jgi:hypothetical protein